MYIDPEGLNVWGAVAGGVVIFCKYNPRLCFNTTVAATAAAQAAWQAWINSAAPEGTQSCPIPDVNEDASDDGECSSYRLAYESNPKHRKEGYWAGGKWVSPEPTNGAVLLQRSIRVSETVRKAVDSSTGEEITYRRHRKDDQNCVEYYHGYVSNSIPTKRR